jgi:hypothetical protein
MRDTSLDAISETELQRALDFRRAGQADYQMTFASPAGRRVLGDLMRYCGALDALVATDPGNGPVDVPRTMMLIGRHQVFRHINNHLHLNPEQLYALYDGRAVQQGDE